MSARTANSAHIGTKTIIWHCVHIFSAHMAATQNGIARCHTSLLHRTRRRARTSCVAHAQRRTVSTPTSPSLLMRPFAQNSPAMAFAPRDLSVRIYTSVSVPTFARPANVKTRIVIYRILFVQTDMARRLQWELLKRLSTTKLAILIVNCLQMTTNRKRLMRPPSETLLNYRRGLLPCR